jgi:hypothetical protein
MADSSKAPKTWGDIMLTVLPGLIIGVAVGQINSCNQTSLTRQQEKERVYTRLVGQKRILLGTIRSHFDARILSDYYARRYALNMVQPRASNVPVAEQQKVIDMDLNESLRKLKLSDDFHAEIMRASRDILETVATASITFKNTDELRRLTKSVLEFGDLNMQRGDLNQIRDLANLEIQISEARNEVPKHVLENFGKPLDALLAHLEGELQTSR